MKRNNIFENFTHKKGVLTVLIIILGFIFGLVYNSCFSIKEYKSNVSITNSYNVDDMQFNTIRDFVFLDNTINELCKYIEADSLAFISEEGLKKSIHFSKEHTCGLCMSCFNGNYVTNLYDSFDKANKFEK